MPEPRAIFVPFILLAQALLVHWAASSERPPSAPDLARFPDHFDGWKQLHEDPIATDVASELGADRLLSRSYGEQSGKMAGLLVAWFQSQRGGASQPHSPKVCLPGAGWIPERTGELRIETAAGAIQVNRYIVSHLGQHVVVLYWYQTPRRAIAGEWAAKFWLVNDAVRDKRTDTALVRITVWGTSRGDDTAVAEAVSFARDLYPLLRNYLPRAQ
jgi:EpsI family protein